jgi:hypothetical protein
MFARNRYDMNFLCEDIYTHESRLWYVFFIFGLILFVIEVEQIYLKGVLGTTCDEGVELAFVIILRVKGDVIVFEPVVHVFQCNVGHVIGAIFGILFNSLVSLSEGPPLNLEYTPLIIASFVGGI